MPPEAAERPIKIAILAMGGEGGGVLADWIVDAAEHAGYHAQTTSVPGVAQRTGATIYYVEILPVQRSRTRTPILGLMPVPGDVDLVIASELMEAGRAVQRGLVTPDRTTLIASSNRVYALPEKMAMGDGRRRRESLYESGRKAARRFVCRDFSALAERHGSVISAALFGAAAATGLLPVDEAACRAAIERGGVGVAASLKAFAAGLAAYHADDGRPPAPAARPPMALDPRLAGLGRRVADHFPAAVHSTLLAGVARCADYQDPAYAGLYLDRLDAVREAEPRAAEGWKLLAETARYLALWMTYEDTARVAELKIRHARFDRVRQDLAAQDRQLLRINEFFHPRLEEIADTVPASLGSWLLRSRWAGGFVRARTRKGRVIRTSTLGGFLLLYGVSRFRRLRPRSLRYQRENAGIQVWLGLLAELAGADYALACQVAECQRLIKGYGDTHARGMRSYRAIMDALPGLRGRPRAAETVRQLREAALADDSGAQLSQLLAGLEKRVSAAPQHAV